MTTLELQNGLLLLLFTLLLTNFCHCYKISAGTKLKLTHRLHTNRANGASQLDRVKEVFHSDSVRHRGISERLLLQKQGKVSGVMPMNSAADFGLGQYLVHLKVGTPAKRVRLVPDTGSELTWVNCNYKCRSRRCWRNIRKKRGVFWAAHSHSFRTISCSSDMCKNDLAELFSLVRCPSPMDPCLYDYRYSGGLFAQGVFGKETVTFGLTNGKKRRLHDMVVGCTESFDGPALHGSDGVLGLSYSNQSFAVRATSIFGGKFSYCLVDHLSPRNMTSYLVFGSHREAPSITRMRYTELVLDTLLKFYAVKIKGISMGGTMLDIPADVWTLNGTGGTIFDSGSSLTSLSLPAYNRVMDVLKPKFRFLDLSIGPLDYCFNSTGYDESIVPRMVFHFKDGARFTPLVKSYVIDAAPEIRCIGVIPAEKGSASVIGNIMQQNHYWEYDLENRRLGFAISSCS